MVRVDIPFPVYFSHKSRKSSVNSSPIWKFHLKEARIKIVVLRYSFKLNTGETELTHPLFRPIFFIKCQDAISAIGGALCVDHTHWINGCIETYISFYVPTVPVFNLLLHH